jgi:predicted dehydrogenase
VDNIRVGVIGLKFGRWHVRTLAAMQGVELVAIADRRPDVPGGLQAYAAKAGAKPYGDGVEMLERERLDAVIVATSPRVRGAIIEKAAAKAVALFVEKPWAANVEQARQLAELCRNRHARIMLAFSFRFHPAIVRLRELLDGPLGAPQLLSGRYVFDWLPSADYWLWDPQVGGGFFNENSCHLFDAVNYLLGTPVCIMAEAGTFNGAPGPSAAAVTVRYASGAVAALSIGGVAIGAFRDFPRIDVIAAKGQAQLQGRDHIWEELAWAVRGDAQVQSLLRPPEVDGRTRYTDALEHFFEAIRNDREFSVGVEDGVKTVAMAAAIYESARTGKKVSLS